jgi:hypothetical protein
MRPHLEHAPGDRPPAPAWLAAVDVGAALVSMACLVASVDLDVLQHSLLPFGSLLAYAVIAWAAWRAWRRRVDRGLAWVGAAGVVAGALTVGALWHLHRIPWMVSCIDCIARAPWYSVEVTFEQGFGFGAVAALLLRRARRARQARAEPVDPRG